MVKAREQSKTLNYQITKLTKINYTTLQGFSLASEFHFKVAFIFATRVHVAH